MFSINAKGGVCWQELQLAQFAQALVLSLMSNFKSKCSLMSNFKNAKGTGVDQYAQAWISVHRRGSVCTSVDQFAQARWFQIQRSTCESQSFERRIVEMGNRESTL
jgi:hypothetical protein